MNGWTGNKNVDTAVPTSDIIHDLYFALMAKRQCFFMFYAHLNRFYKIKMVRRHV